MAEGFFDAENDIPEELTPYQIGDIMKKSIRRTIIQTKEFSRNWDNLCFNDDDLRRLEYEIMSNPDAYPIMRGTGGLRKVRMAMNNKGKSGSARVCFVDFESEECMFLITVYEKKDKANLSMSERREIKAAIEMLKNSLGGKKNGK